MGPQLVLVLVLRSPEAHRLYLNIFRFVESAVTCTPLIIVNLDKRGASSFHTKITIRLPVHPIEKITLLGSLL